MVGYGDGDVSDDRDEVAASVVGCDGLGVLLLRGGRLKRCGGWDGDRGSWKRGDGGDVGDLRGGVSGSDLVGLDWGLNLRYNWDQRESTDLRVIGCLISLRCLGLCLTLHIRLRLYHNRLDIHLLRTHHRLHTLPCRLTAHNTLSLSLLLLTLLLYWRNIATRIKSHRCQRSPGETPCRLIISRPPNIRRCCWHLVRREIAADLNGGRNRGSCSEGGRESGGGGAYGVAGQREGWRGGFEERGEC